MDKIKKCVVEVFSRVTGFFRPVQVWNKGKQEEFKDRKTFVVNIREGGINVSDSGDTKGNAR